MSSLIKTMSILGVYLSQFDFGFITKNIPACSYVFDYSRNNDIKSCINNLDLISNATGIESSSWSFVSQKHTNLCLKIEKPNDYSNLPEADAQITSVPGICLAIQTADCVPIIIIDKVNMQIASIHAGWKGAFSGIIENTINMMNSHTQEFIAIIGPCIKQQSYEIQDDFYKKFIDEDSNNEVFFKNNDNKKFFDVESYAKSKLEKLGIKEIYSINEDTYINQQDWFSYRLYTQGKTKDKGSIISYIRILN